MWIDVNERLPEDGGFKRCKLDNGAEYPIPWALTLAGKRKWLTPGERTVTHWWEEDK